MCVCIYIYIYIYIYIQGRMPMRGPVQGRERAPSVRSPQLGPHQLIYIYIYTLMAKNIGTLGKYDQRRL